MYDSIEQLAFDSSHPVSGAFPVAIIMNMENRDFELIQLPNVAPDIQQMIVTRNLCFVGIVGIVNGTPKSAFQVPLDNAAIAILSSAYLRIVERGMNARLEIDELHRLWAKPSNAYDA